MKKGYIALIGLASFIFCFMFFRLTGMKADERIFIGLGSVLIALIVRIKTKQFGILDVVIIVIGVIAIIVIWYVINVHYRIDNYIL